jgi:hypothetical protein
MRHSAESNFIIEYIGEFETEFENTVLKGVNLGPRGNRLTKNTEDRKSRETALLSDYFSTLTLLQSYKILVEASQNKIKNLANVKDH